MTGTSLRRFHIMDNIILAQPTLVEIGYAPGGVTASQP